MDQQFWIFIIIGFGFLFIVLFSVAYREFRQRFDPYKKIRQEIVKQTGLTMVPMRGDPFALQGSTSFPRLHLKKMARHGWEEHGWKNIRVSPYLCGKVSQHFYLRSTIFCRCWRVSAYRE